MRIKMIAAAALCISFVLAGCSKKDSTSSPETPKIKLESTAPTEYPNMKLVWQDEFNDEGLPDPKKWGYEIGGNGWGNEELQYYTSQRAENAVVKNGNLVITSRKEDFQGRKYTSARLVTRNKGDWLYGRVDVRAKLPSGKGTWPAIWMMPTDSKYGNWPNSGEIDIMEHVGYDMNRIHASTHTLKYYWKTNTQKTAIVPVKDAAKQYHLYSLEWTPGKIQMFVDGASYFVNEQNAADEADGWRAWPFDQRFFLILNIAVGGLWGGQQGVDDNIFPQTMEVDYVRVYQNK